MHRIAPLIVAGFLGSAGGLADAGGKAKAHAYTNTQQHGLDTVHVTKLTFTPLPVWKEHLEKGSALPSFENSAGDTVMLLDDISVFGKTPAEQIDSGVRSMFVDSADASKIERTDRKNGRWWIVDHHAKMHAIHAALFVPEGDGYFAVCDVRVDDPKQLETLAPICDTLKVASSEDRKAPRP
ncbi:MAG TPA: hypothetical protein VFQ65_28140 [Kofleriaceae bacterium]|nr:hypothetical protein [Kofleriaceae bacterium]